MNLGITGRRAIVTGGSRGIGYATARELLQAGVRVAISARDATRRVMSTGFVMSATSASNSLPVPARSSDRTFSRP